MYRPSRQRSAEPTAGSLNLSNSGVEPDTPRFPSNRLTAKEVRSKVRRRLNCSGPWLQYHDARPASKFPFLNRFKSGAAVAAAAGWGVKLALGEGRPIVFGAAILGTYGAIYFAAAHLLGVEECAGALRRLLRRR